MERSRHLAVLRRVVASPLPSPRIEMVLDRAARSLTRLTGDELTSLHLWSADGRTLELQGARGLSARLREVNRVHLPGEGLIGRVATSGQAIALRHVARSPYLLPAARGAVQADGIRAFVCVPIRSAGGVLGTVSMGRQTGEPFTAEDVRMLEVTAAHLGAVLDRSGDATSPSAETEPGRELVAALVAELQRTHQAMLGWTRLLRAHHVTDRPLAAHGLDVLERALARQTRLLGDLHDLSQVVAGGLPCDRRPIDLVATLEAALADCPAGEDPPGAVDLVTDLAICPVLGDERRLRQVIAALVADTVRATGARKRVVVQLQRVRNRARVAVRAAGPAAPRAGGGGWATPGFETGDGAAAPETIELAIARHLVALHGGTLAHRGSPAASQHELVLELPALAGAA